MGEFVNGVLTEELQLLQTQREKLQEELPILATTEERVRSDIADLSKKIASLQAALSPPQVFG